MREVLCLCLWARARVVWLVSYGFDFKARYHNNKYTIIWIALHFQNGEQLNVIFSLRIKKNKHIFFSNYYYYLPAAETPGTTNSDGIRKHNVKYFIQNISDLAKVWFLTSSHIVVIQFCGWCLGVEWKKSKTRSRCTVVPIQWNEYMNPTTTVSKLD